MADSTVENSAIIDPEADLDNFVEQKVNEEKQNVQDILEDKQPTEVSTSETVPEEQTEKSEEAQKPQEETKPEETKPEVSPSKLVKITDEYISSQPEEIQPILREIRNGEMTQRELKSLVESQKFIKKIKPEYEQLQQKYNELLNQKPVNPAPAVSQTDFETQKKLLLEDELRKKYRDLPVGALADNDAFNNYLSNMQLDNPSQFLAFSEDFREAKGIVEKNVNDYQDLQTNWKNNAYTQISSEVKKFKDDVLKEYNIKPEELGIDLDIEGNTLDVVQSLIFNENKELDASVMQPYGETGIYLSMPGGTYNKLWGMLRTKIREIDRKNAAREALDADANRVPKEPSVSDVKSSKENRNEIKDYSGMTDEELLTL